MFCEICIVLFFVIFRSSQAGTIPHHPLLLGAPKGHHPPLHTSCQNTIYFHPDCKSHLLDPLRISCDILFLLKLRMNIQRSVIEMPPSNSSPISPVLDLAKMEYGSLKVSVRALRHFVFHWPITAHRVPNRAFNTPAFLEITLFFCLLRFSAYNWDFIFTLSPKIYTLKQT